MATATLKWTDPTTRVDGSVLAAADIARVDIKDANASDPNAVIGTVAGGVQTFTTGTLDVGTHTFFAYVVDVQGHSSAASNAAQVTVASTLANPAAISDLAATLNP